MPLESATYITGLDRANPLPRDHTRQGDDHLRLIKKVLLETFPNLDAAVTLTPADINGLTNALLSSGGNLSGIIKMLDGSSIDFAETDATDFYARLHANNGFVILNMMDPADLTQVVNSIIIGSEYIEMTAPVRGVTPNGVHGDELVTVDYVKSIDTLMIVEDRKSSGTSGGSTQNVAWSKRDLNTIAHRTIVGATLSNNEVTLPEGVYEITASTPSFRSDLTTTRLIDRAAGTTLLEGSSEKADEADIGATATRSFINGVITLAATTTIYIDHYTRWGHDDGKGPAVSINSHEVYTQLRIRKMD